MKYPYANNNEKIARYVHDLLRPEQKSMLELRREAYHAGIPHIHVRPMDVRHLEVLTQMIRPRRAVEIGTLAGYSAIHIAQALPPDGKLYTLEIEPKHAEFARSQFEKHGLANRIELRLGPAIESLNAIAADGPVDMVFIDADKQSYAKYLDWAATNLRPGGVLIADDVFGFGHIADAELPAEWSEEVLGMRAFNRALADRTDFKTTMLPTSEGLTVAVKI